MKHQLCQWLRCPDCKGAFSVQKTLEERGEIKEGSLFCGQGHSFPIRTFIPRFVVTDGYAESFGFEWRRHSKTQLDSANGNNMSERAFQSRVRFPLSQLRDQVVLDAGCGMGRYAEVAAKYGATVIGVDRSEAVDIAFKNIGSLKNVNVVQADLFHLPFQEEIFDFIYSYGVLHHTPDAQKAFEQLPPFLKEGGSLSIFVYSNYNKVLVVSSNFWRKLTTRLPRPLLYGVCTLSVPLYYLYRLPVIGNLFKAIWVISMEKDWRWRLLDTFDWYAPRYQSKHTHAELFRWFEGSGLEDISIFDGEITMMGTKRRILNDTDRRDRMRLLGTESHS